MSQQNRGREPDVGGLKDDQLQWLNSALTQEQLEEKSPNRPVNHSQTLLFQELVDHLFVPLVQNKKVAGVAIARAKLGPDGPKKKSPHDIRRNVIEKFMSRWRSEVGDDFFPAMRLILPEKDKDRPMYGIKELTLAKLIAKLLRLSKHSDDSFNLFNWKLPARGPPSVMSGDFPGRCYEAFKDRPGLIRGSAPLRIAEVNAMLDELAVAQKEDQQLLVFRKFYQRMNARDLLWVIRIVLKQLKIGSTERTVLDVWHPDGELKFSLCSSLRQVCWELPDPTRRLLEDDQKVTLMEPFQPQLAQFMDHSFQTMIELILKDNPKSNNSQSQDIQSQSQGIIKIRDESNMFWIEEKLDGERMQMHMEEDASIPGGRRFRWLSRKAKDYTYLYGQGFHDSENSSLTIHLKDAFKPEVKNIILDGEMITWDPAIDRIAAFGTLKSAAISESGNPYEGTKNRPLFRVFDCLYFNGMDIRNYTLKDRRRAIAKCVNNVHRRLEIHGYEAGFDTDDVETKLREVVAKSAEGLVLKNPFSRYELNSRNNNWMKVKPEYMTEFGESLDCLVIGGYYGNGQRGGFLASFLCGLRGDGPNSNKFYSFFKVGGGFTASDYKAMPQLEHGKWMTWDRARARKYIELAGPEGDVEKPDMWIKPEDSVVLEVKAASADFSASFKAGFTLRFPRFKKIRTDKDWQSALSIKEFVQLKKEAEAKNKEAKFTVATKKRRITRKLKQEIVIAGMDDGGRSAPYVGPTTQVFAGLSFFVQGEMQQPVKRSKAEIEEMIKKNGGSIFHNATASPHMIVIAEKKLLKIAGLIKSGGTNVVRPKWVWDAVQQAKTDGEERGKFILPFEPDHMFHVLPEAAHEIEETIDEFGDSYARDVGVEELRRIFDGMPRPQDPLFEAAEYRNWLEERGTGLGQTRGSLFRGCVAHFAEGGEMKVQQKPLQTRFLFAGGKVAALEDEEVTHVVVIGDEHARATWEEVVAVRGKRLPRMVKADWVEDSWTEGTRIDEERYAFSLG